jgi:hypothetical protein
VRPGLAASFTTRVPGPLLICHSLANALLKVNKLVSYRYQEWVFYKVGQNTNKIISAEKLLFIIAYFFYGKNKVQVSGLQ